MPELRHFPVVLTPAPPPNQASTLRTNPKQEICTLPTVATAVATTIRKPPLPALTGIRTLLALSIVLFHYTPSHLGPLYPFVDNGYIFVGVFFLISGYILTYNYADRGAAFNKRNFWVARFARLYPIYLLALVVSIKMLEDEWQVRSHAEFWKGVILTPVLLQGWSPDLATFWNTVAWTLSCEVMLYIAFPWLIRIPWPKTAGRLIALLLAVWAIGMVPHSLYLLLNPDHLTGPVTRYTYLSGSVSQVHPAALRLYVPGRCGLGQASACTLDHI